MRIRDLGRLFPDNQVVATCYDMNNAEEIETQYKLIEIEVARLKNKEDNSGCILAQILYARMRIEQLKVPTFIEQAKKFLREGNAVAIFVNFTQTLRTIADELKTNCLIHGQQTLDERDKAIGDFNSDKSHIIICNIRSGGVGISIQDQHGNFPRVSIISPSWSAQDIIQALGRIYRANGKTPCRQRIVFCKGTIEETICQNMKEKIQNIALLNDGDLLSYNIDGLTDDPDAIGIDPDANLSEFDKLFLRVNVLNIKRSRLLVDLKETENEIKLLEIAIENTI
jgi:SNF2 family DNA or RNA helicase